MPSRSQRFGALVGGARGRTGAVPVLPQPTVADVMAQVWSVVLAGRHTVRVLAFGPDDAADYARLRLRRQGLDVSESVEAHAEVLAFADVEMKAQILQFEDAEEFVRRQQAYARRRPA